MRGKRKTEEDYHKLAKSRGFKWIGSFPRNVAAKTMWQCTKGHQWKAHYNGIQLGHGCPYCAGVVPKTIEDYHAVAKEYGFKWIGERIPKNVNVTTWWECQQGHRWKSRYNNIKTGRGCPYCYNLAHTKTAADYYALAKEKGIEWLGPFPTSAHDKTWWKCPENHRWQNAYSFIKQGSGCPYCAGKARKTPADYHALAKEYGFEWIGDFPPTVLDNTLWRCANGHTWETHYNNISRGRGCLYCYEIASRKTPDDYHALAKECGFNWLEPFPPNAKSKTLWECPNGHQWEARYTDIKQGSGCPECVRVVNGHRISKIQRRLCKMLSGKLNYPCGSYRIDVALPDQMIAIEYDSWYWHGNKQEEDRQRDKDLISSDWKVLHIKSNAKLPSKKKITEALNLLGNGQKLVEIILDDWGHGPIF